MHYVYMVRSQMASQVRLYPLESANTQIKTVPVPQRTIWTKHCHTGIHLYFMLFPE